MSQHLEEVTTSTLNQKLSQHHSAVATSKTRDEDSHIIRGRDIHCKEKKVATSFSSRDIKGKRLRSRHHLVVATSVAKKIGRDINCKDLRSRHHLAVATSSAKERGSRHHSLVATSAAKEGRSRQHLAVATSDPRDAKDKSRPNKSFYDITETTEVATKNRCRDINNKMGQLI